jgi:hypothetical protein
MFTAAYSIAPTMAGTIDLLAAVANDANRGGSDGHPHPDPCQRMQPYQVPVPVVVLSTAALLKRKAVGAGPLPVVFHIQDDPGAYHPFTPVDGRSGSIGRSGK